MSLPANLGEQPPGKEGFAGHLRALGASVAAYLAARLQLAGMESKEAAGHYARIAALLAVALFGVVFGYIFLCLSVIFILQLVLKISWIWILLGAALFHLAAAVAALLAARAKFPRAVFSATIAEFKKDQTWLNTPPETTRPS